ncbi:hypothetical protein [Bradyrhizobium canariense]|uniref:hypothetical protein n=1 Tax=Bradyrhizobium canariense TaxID=255045 RepID=UPI001CA4EFF0|nr:hypothetical protein [Bradyrhizobium canariense]
MRYELSDYEWTAIKPMLRTSRAVEQQPHLGACMQEELLGTVRRIAGRQPGPHAPSFEQMIVCLLEIGLSSAVPP